MSFRSNKWSAGQGGDAGQGTGSRTGGSPCGICTRNHEPGSNCAMYCFDCALYLFPGECNHHRPAQRQQGHQRQQALQGQQQQQQQQQQPRQQQQQQHQVPVQPSGPRLTQLENENQQLRRDLTQLRGEITQLRSDVSQLRVDQLRKEITQSRVDAGRARLDIAQLRLENGQMRVKENALREDNDHLRQRVQNAEAALGSAYSRLTALETSRAMSQTRRPAFSTSFQGKKRARDEEVRGSGGANTALPKAKKPFFETRKAASKDGEKNAERIEAKGEEKGEEMQVDLEVPALAGGIDEDEEITAINAEAQRLYDEAMQRASFRGVQPVQQLMADPPVQAPGELDWASEEAQQPLDLESSVRFGGTVPGRTQEESATTNDPVTGDQGAANAPEWQPTDLDLINYSE